MCLSQWDELIFNLQVQIKTNVKDCDNLIFNEVDQTDTQRKTAK